MEQYIWDIRVTDPSPTSRFAAEEFARLIALMDPAGRAVVSAGGFDPGQKALWIGVDAKLPAPPPVEDPESDDAVYIDVRDGAGFITGSNVRSVLIGVYRFFRECGCVFVRPGRDGEAVPRRPGRALAVRVREAAAYRCRGICLEGAAGYEHVADMIDFAPKLGFNAYFTQLFRPAFAFTRWYEHRNNPTLLPAPVSNATIDSFVRDCDAAIRLRGLDHHRIGHGWISKVLGITSGAWHEKNDDSEVLPDRRKFIAMIDGRRELFDGSGIDTNLCCADPEAAELLADEVVKFARENESVRYLHFWFADHANNQCMCEKCRDQRPADQYVRILNRIDERLTAAGLKVRIVFLIYLDLLWAPVHEKLRNPERFVLLYAPIRRSYSVPMATDRGHREVPFVRNGFVPVPEAGGTLPYLEAWRRSFGGDCFIFDYHYMWDYLNDPGGIACARIMEKDVENLRLLELKGMLSCQNQRVFMPCGVGMTLMGEALWSGNAAFAERSNRYFAAAYGADGGSCLEFLEKLSLAFDPEVLRGEKPVRGAENAAGYAALPAVIDGFLPVIRKNLAGAASPLVRRSWECLEFHAEVCRKLAALLLGCARGERAEEQWAAVRGFVCENEMRFQREFDVFEFILVWENKILPRLRAGSENAIE